MYCKLFLSSQFHLELKFDETNMRFGTACVAGTRSIYFFLIDALCLSLLGCGFRH
jgi:hypothetical protein